MKKEIVLFEHKENCCGCGACANICPGHAIAMQKDELGFCYPAIVSEKCVGCGLCKDVCGFQKENDAPLTMAAYAVQANDEKLIARSASGGVFAMLAEAVLDEGGAVVGCALEHDQASFVPRHIMIDSLSELEKLQGSKYVQSRTEAIYIQVKNALDSGRKVLFSGTPCQVDAMKNSLRGKVYPNLLTVDLICHGTPSVDMFADYLRLLEKRLNGRILDFKFRDKSAAWGYDGNIRVTYKDKQGNEKEYTFPARNSSFYKIFQTSEIHRDSCYNCKYACLHRPGDLTIGDFWGIEKQHPDALKENGGQLVKERGISCVLVNTEQGRVALDSLSDRATLMLSKIDAVICENAQLDRPPVPGKNRDKIWKMYRTSGYKAVDRWFVREQFVHKCFRKLKRLLGR